MPKSFLYSDAVITAYDSVFDAPKEHITKYVPFSGQVATGTS